jgi:hypothetical protein
VHGRAWLGTVAFVVQGRGVLTPQRPDERYAVWRYALPEGWNVV